MAYTDITKATPKKSELKKLKTFCSFGHRFFRYQFLNYEKKKKTTQVTICTYYLLFGLQKNEMKPLIRYLQLF